MLFVMNTRLGYVGLYVIDTYTYNVYDSDDGSVEKHNGREIIELCRENPDLFCNIGGKECNLFYENNQFPYGLFKISKTNEYFIHDAKTGMFVYADGVLYVADLQDRPSPILKRDGEYYYFTSCGVVELQIDKLMSMKPQHLKRLLSIESFGDYIQGLEEYHAICSMQGDWG